jgi:hypothetical protein
MKPNKIQLGNWVEDKITGFAGYVTGRVEYITGCNQILVQPKCKEGGEFVDSRWVDETRLQVLNTNTGLEALKASDSSNLPGADTPAPRK